jgi:hypothetical protein
MNTQTPKIKLIVTHYWYWSKTNGYSTWHHKVTSVYTGKDLILSSPHESNMRSILLDAGFEYVDCHEDTQNISFNQSKHLDKEKDCYALCVEVPEALIDFLDENVTKYL